MSYTVTFKKVFTGIEQDDEGEALDEASHMLGSGMVSHTGLEDYFDTLVQKEPVKDIVITTEGLAELIPEHEEEAEPTEAELQEFIDFLELDTTDWIMQNWRAFKTNKSD